MRRHRNENIVGTTASDLRAMAEDMLRMGTHWAQAAQGWLDRTRQDVEARDRHQRCASERSGRDFQSDYSGGGYDQVRGSRGNYAARGGYRGVGPRNYSRSDERIREDLNERLTEADDLDASDITVEVSNGVATLGGMVPQRWMKHRAEDLADGCTGVRDVRNQIRVGDAGRSTTGQSTSGGAEAHGSVR
ncbi:MAG TPA: BON domain-containing protein, partial [Luteimonas sp.]|nr:BON domain-containing protein [Luteimonas sp.]